LLVQRYTILGIFIIIFTLIFIFIIKVATNEDFRNQVSDFLPFSPNKGGKQPPILLVILIIIGSMVLAYFF